MQEKLAFIKLISQNMVTRNQVAAFDYHWSARFACGSHSVFLRTGDIYVADKILNLED